MVVQTLRAMALGGMRDHIGGGFHRYSVDGDWRVPHFEKMLYDQAQIVLACLEAAQAGEDPFFAQIAEDTLQYVRRDMTDARGGFYSAEDADSLPPEASASAKASATSGPRDAHKIEGAFYVWTADEILAQLGDDAPTFVGRYGVLPNGNAPFDPQHEFVNKNLLYTALSIADIAKALKQDADRRRRIAAAIAQDPVRRARAAAAAAARRQGADGVERPDDRRVRARLARAGRRASLGAENARIVDRGAPAECDCGGVVHSRRDVECGQQAAVAPLSRR